MTDVETIIAFIGVGFGGSLLFVAVYSVVFGVKRGFEAAASSFEG